MAKLKLIYFDGRGVAEKIRYLLALSGADWEDERMSLTFGTPGDFSTIKRPEFDAAKASGELDISMGKVPILVLEDGTKIPQSKSIERYVAKRFGLMGSSDAETAQIDALAEHERDMKDAYMKAKAAKEVEKYFSETLPEFLGKLEKAVGDKPSPFLAGSACTYADVVFYVFLTEFFDDKESVAVALDKAPKIKAVVDAVAEVPGIKKWAETRPKTMF